MQQYLIRGGNKLEGSVEISSSKNAVLPMIAAAILTNEEVIIKKCPKISDVFAMMEILQSLGVKTFFCEDNLIIQAQEINSETISKQLANKLRTSILMMGALLSRTGKVEIAYPGGCNIGKRPIDIHFFAFKKLGAKIIEKENKIISCALTLTGTVIYLPYPSVGATENILLASVLAKGDTTIINYAKEPEINDFINFLCSMGAKITKNSNKIFITGVESLHGTVYSPISDRIEGGTFLLATAITGGKVQIKNINLKNISSLVGKLCDNTCKISIKNDIIYVKTNRIKKSFNLFTGPYPNFPTDLQPLTVALLSVSKGISTIQEDVFEHRFEYVKQLIQLGADISVNKNVAIVRGIKRFQSGNVVAPDLRGGAALVIAGLNAEGITKISHIDYIERGYENFEKKLQSLGANIIKEKTN